MLFALKNISLAVSDSQFTIFSNKNLTSRKRPVTNFGASRFSPRTAEVLQFCLAYGGDPHRDTEGVLPTEAAAAMGALQALAMLLRIGAVPGGKIQSASGNDGGSF